jgi:hypothetical protein
MIAIKRKYADVRYQTGASPLSLSKQRQAVHVGRFVKPCMVTLLDIVFPMSHAMVEVLMVLQGFLLR